MRDKGNRLAKVKSTLIPLIVQNIGNLLESLLDPDNIYNAFKMFD